MSDINYKLEHLGFVACDAGISQVAWVAFASAHPYFQKQPPIAGINPFTRQAMQYQHNNYLIVDGEAPVGLAVWEASQCIGLAGNASKLESLIALLCKAFNGKFHPSNS